MNGKGRRKCQSWIESFINFSSNVESAHIFRKWAAITTIAATLEQKVWFTTSAQLFPNLYTFLIGHPGVGKTRTITAASKFIMELPEPHIAPTSMTMASMTDCLVESKRSIHRLPDPPLEYNSMYIMADELSAFMHEYNLEMIGGLTTFYDVVALPYGQYRRGKEIKIRIKRPQLSILVGSTPSNLVKFIPEIAWDQGFCSRVILIYSDERPMMDIFENPFRELPPDMVHDLKMINGLVGGFRAEIQYRKEVNDWRASGLPPTPTHPKLSHYNTRRLTHLLKLSMIASIDRDNELILTVDDFNTAKGWLLEAESYMSDIFQAGAPGADAKAMDEIVHYIRAVDMGKGVAEHKINKFAADRVPLHTLWRIVNIMESTGMIKAVSIDTKTGTKNWSAI